MAPQTDYDSRSNVRQQVLDDVDQLVGPHGLHHHRRRAELLRAFSGPNIAGGGEDHNAGPRMLGREPDRLEQLQPVGVERRVEDEDIRLEVSELGAHLADRLRPVHVVANQGEAVDHLLGDGGLILSNQDAGADWRHHRASYGSDASPGQASSGEAGLLRTLAPSMPLPPHVLLGTERTRRGSPDGNRFTRWLHRPARHTVSSDSRSVATRIAPEPTKPFGAQVDAETRAFWAGSETAAISSRRAAALVDAHERGRGPAGGRPPGNPAFSEALFVELMRASQYRRAFTLLSDDCQLSWGSPEAFAEAQGASTMRRLHGVSVKAVRYLPEWTDASRGATYHDVAELDVEYEVGDPEPVARLRRVVHLVPGGGRWRSICYPV